MVRYGVLIRETMARRESGRPKKKCRSEKENDRIVQKMRSAGSNEATGERS